MRRLFLIAVRFLTRLPLPLPPARDPSTAEEKMGAEEALGRAAVFFPLVGALIGGSAAILHVALLNLFPPSTCVLLVLAYASFITNALHEDGLADAFDGFGGGWLRDRVLEIMRDSRIGTFGTLALVFLVLSKYNSLSALEPHGVWRWLIVAHAAARWTSLPLCLWLPPARATGQGRLVAQKVGYAAMTIATLMLLATLALLPLPAAALALAATLAVSITSGLYYRRRLGGVTGDCLGATNQLTEVSIYLVATSFQ